MIRSWRLGVVCGLACASGCELNPTPPPVKKVPPAVVAHTANEQELATVVLTPEAEKRLAVATVSVARKQVRRRRTLGGEVIVPQGWTVSVSAPMAGTVAAPAGGQTPKPGARVAKDQAVFAFTPLLSPEREVLTPPDRVRLAEARASLATSQIESERQVETAKVQHKTAETALRRAEQLERDGAGTKKAVEEAQAALSLARETLFTAEARHKLLAGISLDMEAGELAPREVVSPLAGMLHGVYVAAGESVATGDPLFTVARDDKVWIRVPVYVGAWREIDVEAVATVREFGAAADTPGWQVRHVLAPPSANAAAATIDLYYDLENAQAELTPGQKVAVTLSLKSEEKSKVVPWASILHDIHGGTWVYERVAERTYVRRRVVVSYVAEEDGAPLAVLAAGPEAGASIVTEGAAELFGTEFGFGK